MKYNIVHKKYRIKKKSAAGFTLVEVVVSIALFSIVMVVCVAALLALVNANRKAQALQSVMNNLNIALDDMARNVRMGTHFFCGAVPPYVGTRDCTQDDGLNTTFVFEHFGGNPADFGDQWIYYYDAATKQIWKSTDGGATSYPITSREVTIDSLKFYAVGTTQNDTIQPRMVAVVRGTAAAQNAKSRASFHIQVTSVQRSIDL